MALIEQAEAYDEWFGRNGNIFESEALAIEELIPYDVDLGDAIDVGCGTGLFSIRLGIPFGIEPSESMAELARRKGIDVMIAPAEDIPFGGGQFSLALLCGVTSYLTDRRKAIQEVYRILRPNGYLILADVQKGIGFAELYERAVREGKYPEGEAPETPYPIEFAKLAKWPEVSELFDLLHQVGFTSLETRQTLTTKPKEANKTVERPKPGHESGSWVVIRGVKRNLKSK
jgi:SAM-dependent methyltransferase